jgi:hypothetical protein
MIGTTFVCGDSCRTWPRRSIAGSHSGGHPMGSSAGSRHAIRLSAFAQPARSRPAARGQSSASTDTDLRELDCPHSRIRLDQDEDPGRHEGRPRQRDGCAASNPKLSARQEAHLVALHAVGGHTISELEELFSITRSTVYRALTRDRARAAT